jgi:hypothetical protein
MDAFIGRDGEEVPLTRSPDGQIKGSSIPRKGWANAEFSPDRLPDATEEVSSPAKATTYAGLSSHTFDPHTWAGQFPRVL